jgi:hypothetical protein
MPGYSTPTTKAQICYDKAAGLHETEIAEKFGLYRTTVLCCHAWYELYTMTYMIRNIEGDD